MLARVVGGVVQRPLLPGNRIEPLINGDEAFPAMLEAIGQARGNTFRFLHLYLRPRRVGLAFARALGEASVRRGCKCGC